MADRYLLESGAPDGYLLEDGSGVLLLDDILDTPLTVTAASFDIDGQTVGGEAISSLDPATFDIDGQSITLTLGTPLAVTAAAFDIDGQDVTLTVTANWLIDVTAAAIQPAAQTVAFAWTLAVDSAAIQPAGQDIILTLTVDGAITLAVDAAAFQLDGQAIDLTLTSDAQPEEETQQTPAGRKKRRYIVEIDGREFTLDSLQAAQDLLDRAAQLARVEADRKAEIAVSDAMPQARRIGKAETIRLELPTLKGPKELSDSLNAIRQIYQDAAQAAELRILLELDAERDDEEALLLSL